MFFPPRLQIVTLEKDADRLPAYRWSQFSPRHLGSDQPHRPTGSALRRRRANHGHDPLTLLHIQGSLLAWTRLLVQCRIQSLFLAASGDGSYGRHSSTRTDRRLNRALALIQLTQNPGASQHAR